tara:strand:+ start:1102 stop:2280 length:1179 start_codon:yes stop_codon:yes gene_type:complete
VSTAAATADLPLALYVHLPWCARKCPYCDFNSHAVRAPIPQDAYVDALIRDLDFELQQGESRALSSIFFGGGTPSLFSAASIGRILDAAAKRLHFSDDIEITLEANPGTADAAHFSGYRTAGVNRMSIGVQSFSDASLKAIGRIHDGVEARRAIELARAAGFDNFNLDLMFALPQQSIDAALMDLTTALSLAPQHLSWYHLTLEPNTEFAVRPPPIPDSDTAADMHDQGCALLGEAGFEHYETSAFARPGRASRHNLNYWQFGDYLGIGAGAHAKRSFMQADGMDIQRRSRHKHPRTFMETAGTAAAVQETRQVELHERAFEFCMNALRLHQGFSLDQFEARSGLPLSALQPRLDEAVVKGLIQIDSDGVRPTPSGLRYQNRLISLFLPEAD